MSSVSVVRIERDDELALIVVCHPSVNTIDAGVRAGLALQVPPLLVQLVEQGRTIAQWEAEGGAGR